MLCIPLAAASSVPTVPVGKDGHLPMVSLGTGSGQHADVAATTSLWLTSGGTAIDTAYMYHDEQYIKQGIAAAGAARDSFFLTTKILCGTKRHAKSQIADNLKQLGMTTVDLMLIHFPECEGGSVADTWAALEEAYQAGQSKAIGVSNFVQSDLEKLQKTATVWPPAVNQVSMSVSKHDDATLAYADAHGIVSMAYSPLCGGSNGSSCRSGSVLSIPLVQQIAQAHNVSTAQVGLKWVVQQGRPLATAVARKDYMLEDLDLWSWGELTDAEMKQLSDYAGKGGGGSGGSGSVQRRVVVEHARPLYV